jgi:adhesin HecA-like repeat protein
VGHAQANDPALNAEGFIVTGNLSVIGVRAHSRSSDGTIQLSGAHIGGDLKLPDGTLINESGPALYADDLTVDGSAVLNGLTAIGHGEHGAVRLLGGHVGGELQFRGGTLTNESGAALHAASLTVDSSAYLDNGFTATGHGEKGAVRLPGGHIGGPLHLEGGTLTNESGPALYADNLTVDSNAYLIGLTAAGHGANGAVRLLGGHIGGQFDLRGATLTNESGPALYADNLTVDSSVFLDDGFVATGHGKKGAVRWLDGHIGSELRFGGGHVFNESGPALNLDNLTVDSSVFLNDGFVATGHGENGAIRLKDVAIKRELFIDVGSVKSSSDRSHRLVVDGMTYQGLSGPSWDAWLGLLRSATPSYAPQPYRQLAAITTAAGHDSDTRHVLRKQTDSGDTSQASPSATATSRGAPSSASLPSFSSPL